MNKILKSKILTLPALLRKLRSLRQTKKVAFTNGCFDLLHYGHVNYLQKAKGPGRILVVGLNSDASIRRIKGPSRPVVPQAGRAAVVAALQAVDFVVVFEEDTPQKLIEKIRPDILIKGADWKGRPVAGGDAVRSRGGKIEFIRYEEGFSTTGMIKKLLAASARQK